MSGLPKAGDVLRIGQEASVQFGGDRAILFRVIRVPQLEPYAEYVWLDGYQLSPCGDAAVERREIYVKIGGWETVV